MTLNDWLTIGAIIVGPLIAISMTRYLDDRREKHGRKLQVFRILMATRAANLTPDHINALNSIDLEFSTRNEKDKKVRSSWLLYLDHLGNHNYPREQWGAKRIELLVDLLFDMANSCGYSFDKTHIKNGVYSPTAIGELEDDQITIRRGLREILTGRRQFPVRIEVGDVQEPDVLTDLFATRPPGN